MDTTIKALAEIEERAKVILEHAYSSQQEMSKKHSEDIEALEKQIKDETNQRIEDLKKKLAMELTDRIGTTKKENARAIGQIEEIYKANHQKIVQKIFNSITAL